MFVQPVTVKVERLLPKFVLLNEHGIGNTSGGPVMLITIPGKDGSSSCKRTHLLARHHNKTHLMLTIISGWRSPVKLLAGMIFGLVSMTGISDKTTKGPVGPF